MQSLKEVKDECSLCSLLLECELCRQGHGIKTERCNITKMMQCQYEHEKKRNKG